MKEQKIRLSVIIPMYQAEQYIAECLQSVISQGIDGLEILCVDDGSSDQTCTVVESFAMENPIVTLIRCMHGGVSRARNAGIKRAKGKYLLFLDADDRLCAGKLPKVLRMAEKRDVDIVVFAGTTSEPYETPYWIRVAFSPRRRVYHSVSPEILQERAARPSACNKLYRRRLLQEHGIYFDEELTLAEDHEMQFLIFPIAQKVIFTNCRLYYYRIHQASSAVGKAEKNHPARLQIHLLAMRKVYEKWKSCGFWQDSAFRRVYAQCFLDFLFEELYELQGEMRREFAVQLYNDLMERFGDTPEDLGEWIRETEILAFYEEGRLKEAEERLKNMREFSMGKRLYLKLSAPVRYCQKAGLRSAGEHYIGKLLGKQEY